MTETTITLPSAMSPLSPAPEDLKAMTPEQLDAERRRIVGSAGGNYRNLSEGDLMRLAFITGTLRRRASGPPKEPKAPKGPKTKPTLASIEDDLL